MENKNLELDMAMKALGSLGKVNELKKAKEEIKIKDSTMFQVTEDIMDVVDKRIENLTIEELEKLSDEEVVAIYTVNGTEIDFNMNIDEKKGIEFKKDFLIYKKNLDIYNNDIDTSLEEIQKEMVEHEIEFNDLVSKYGSIWNVMRERMVLSLDTAEDKETILKTLEMYDSGLNLKCLKEYVSNCKPKNILKDYSERSEIIYKKYLNNIKTMGLKTDLTKLSGFEAAVLPEYNKFPNLLMFIAIRYIAFPTNPITNQHGMFLSSFAMIAKAAMEGQLTDENKLILESSVKEILEPFVSL